MKKADREVQTIEFYIPRNKILDGQNVFIFYAKPMIAPSKSSFYVNLNRKCKHFRIVEGWSLWAWL